MGNSDHMPSMSSLLAGLTSSPHPNGPKHFIHLGGIDIVADFLDTPILVEPTRERGLMCPTWKLLHLYQIQPYIVLSIG